MGVIDTSISLGNILTIVTVGGGIVAMFATMRSNLVTLTNNQVVVRGEMGELRVGIKSEMVELKMELKELGKALTSVAVQNERLNAMDNRLAAQGRRLDEVRSVVSRIEGGRFDQLVDQLNRVAAQEGR